LAAAQRAFGTSFKEDTVNRALREVADLLERHEARLAAERPVLDALEFGPHCGTPPPSVHPDAYSDRPWLPPLLRRGFLRLAP
jgi:hypothetical protein